MSQTFEQAFHLLCRREIGRGMSRIVYDSDLLPGCVIKIEDDAGKFQNVVEWETWNRVKNTDYSRWFAECKSISGNGSILIMERTRPAGMAEFLEKMPAFFCDFKRTNYGTVASSATRSGKPGAHHLVCHDYGTSLIFEHGLTKRMRKADWWDA